jgi:hypothetical protein
MIEGGHNLHRNHTRQLPENRAVLRIELVRKPRHNAPLLVHRREEARNETLKALIVAQLSKIRVRPRGCNIIKTPLLLGKRATWLSQRPFAFVVLFCY